MASKFFDDTCANTKRRIIKKMVEQNRLKRSRCDPLDRTMEIEHVHETVAGNVLLNNFPGDERVIRTVEELERIFNFVPLVKFLGSGDMSFIVPWVATKRHLDDNELLARRMLIPLKTVGDELLCFMPCGSPATGSENFEPPAWASAIPVTSIMNVDWSQEENLRKPGKTKIKGIEGDDTALDVICTGEIEEGDYIFVNTKPPQTREITAVGPNALGPEGQFERIKISPTWTKAFGYRNYYIIKPPFVYGAIRTFKKDDLVELKNVLVTYQPKQDNIGTIKIFYRNAAFNAFGYFFREVYEQKENMPEN